MNPAFFYAFLIIVIAADIIVVDSRYFTKNNYIRKRENTFYAATAADNEVLKDKSYYRVYDIQDYPQLMNDARSSYFHHSIGGYHGAKMRRYEDLYDSCLFRETGEFIQDAQSGKLDFNKYGVMNMLNVKYIIYGPEQNNVVANPGANGSAWFVDEIEKAASPTEELVKLCAINTRRTAVVDESQFKTPAVSPDSTATIQLLEQSPKVLTYQSESSVPGLAVFSEVYYAEGWKATIDGTPADILRADYILRALAIPAGKHKIEFRFEPDAYYVGNKVTMASSWMVLLALIGSLGWTFYKGE